MESGSQEDGIWEGYSLLTQAAQPSISTLGTIKRPAPVSPLSSPSCSNSCFPFSSASPLTHRTPNPHFYLLPFVSPILAASSPTCPFAPCPFLSLCPPQVITILPHFLLPLTLSSLSPVTIRSNMPALQTSTPRMPRPQLVIPVV